MTDTGHQKDSEIARLASEMRATVEQYDVDTLKFMSDFRLYLIKNFGDRCPDFDPGCGCCKIWKLYDQVKEIVE